LQHHSEQNKVFLFKYYCYDTTDKGIRVDLHHGLIEINSKARLCNVNDVFVFAKQCEQVYYTYIHSFKNDRSIVDWNNSVSIFKRELENNYYKYHCYC
jgi:hypothetical protein